MSRNHGQRRCRYCRAHGGDYGRHPGNCLPPEELKALAAYAAEHGKQWRAKLRLHWFHGGDHLRYLRNAVGPAQLHKIKPPAINR